MKTISIILIIAGCAVAQKKTPNVQDLKNEYKLQMLDLADRYSDVVDYAIQQENLVKIYSDSLHALRDSLKTSKGKK